MVIECTECRTRFRMADDKLKPGGTRVRCTKCKHIFTVHPPTETEEMSFAAEEPEGAAFSPEKQEAATGEDFSFAPEATAYAASRQQEDPFSIDSPEADFSFDSDGAAAADDTFSLGGDTGEAAGESFGFGEGHETDLDLGGDTAAPPLSFAFDDEDPDGGPSTVDSSAFAEDRSSDGAAADGGSFDFSLEDSRELPWQGDQAGAAPRDEGEEHYDFSSMTFGGDDSEPPEPPPSRPAPPFPPPRGEGFAAPPSTSRFDEATADEPFNEEPFSSVPVRRSSPWAVLLLLLLLLVGGGAGYFYWADGLLDLDRIMARFGGQPAQTLAPGQVRLTDLHGAFVENTQLGPIFVIRGKTVNDFQETRSAIAVKGVLYNDGGKPLLQQTVFAGNPLDDTALRSLPFEKIEEHMNNQFGDSLSNLNIAPGKAIPFTIVFKNLPTDLAEFTVEVVDSKPVSR
jgi:predicted Zn finger-like uncharacterized protein